MTRDSVKKITKQAQQAKCLIGLGADVAKHYHVDTYNDLKANFKIIPKQHHNNPNDPKLVKHRLHEALVNLLNGKTVKEVAHHYHIGSATIYKYFKNHHIKGIKDLKRKYRMTKDKVKEPKITGSFINQYFKSHDDGECSNVPHMHHLGIER